MVLTAYTEPTANAPPAPPTLTVAQVAQLSGVSSEDLTGLVDFGVLMPEAPDQQPWSFSIGWVTTLQRANSMRDDLALDEHAFALAVMLLQQISGLEAEQRSLQSELYRYRASAQPAYHAD